MIKLSNILNEIKPVRSKSKQQIFEEMISLDPRLCTDLIDKSEIQTVEDVLFYSGYGERGNQDKETYDKCVEFLKVISVEDAEVFYSTTSKNYNLTHTYKYITIVDNDMVDDGHLVILHNWPTLKIE